MSGVQRCLYCGIAAVAVGVSGCASRTYSVEGVVVFADGQPATELAGGAVEFEIPGGDTSARGEIGPEARFSLGTFKRGDGAVPGTHRALVIGPTGNPDHPPPRVLAPRFESFETSGLEFVVKPEKNQLTIQVERVTAP